MSPLLNPARNKDEPFDQYKQRRQIYNVTLSHYLKRGVPFYTHEFVVDPVTGRQKKGIPYRKPKEG